MGSVTIRHGATTGIEKAIAKMKPVSVKIGWFPSARYDDEDRTPVASVAAQNEYGNPYKRIPARPFIRPAIAQNEKKWADIGKRGLRAVVYNKSTVIQVLQDIGSRAVGDIQHSIDQVYSPPLSRRTIEARLARRTHKGRLNKTQARTITKPLLDTGKMRATVAYELSSGS